MTKIRLTIKPAIFILVFLVFLLENYFAHASDMMEQESLSLVDVPDDILFYIFTMIDKKSVLNVAEANVKLHRTAASFFNDNFCDFKSEIALQYGSIFKLPIKSAIFSPDSTKVITITSHGSAKMWNVITGDEIAEIDTPLGTVIFSPNGKLILGSSRTSNDVLICFGTTGKLKLTLRAHSHRVTCVAFSNDGKLFLTASDRENIVRVYNAKAVHIFTLENEGLVESASFSSGGKYILTRGSNYANIWNTDEGALIRSWNTKIEPFHRVKFAQFSPDGKQVLIIFFRESVKVFDLVTNTITFNLVTGSHIESDEIASDGKNILIVHRDGTVIWDTDTTNSLWFNCIISGAIFSPDGNFFVAISSSPVAKIYNSKTGALMSNLIGHGDDIHSVSFSSDGKYIVTISRDMTAKIWSKRKIKSIEEIRSQIENEPTKQKECSLF